MVDSSKPIDLAKAAKLSGLGAFLASVMMRTCGLSSIVCNGVVVRASLVDAVVASGAVASAASVAGVTAVGGCHPIDALVSVSDFREAAGRRRGRVCVSEVSCAAEADLLAAWARSLRVLL